MPLSEIPPQLVYRNGNTRAIRIKYLKANVWELFVCALSIIASVEYWINPVNLSNSSVGQVRFPDEIWNTMYGLGAIMVVLGLWRLSPRVEISGLIMFSTAILINMIAIGHYRGFGTAASTISLLIAFLLAALVRTFDVLRSWRLDKRLIEQVKQAHVDTASAERRLHHEP